MRRIATALAAALLGVAAAATPALAGGGGGHGNCSRAGTAKGAQVVMQALCFAPGTLAIAPGTTVRFVNYDEAPHTVTSTDGSGALELKFDQGMWQTIRFSTAGVYRYYCFVHPGMTGVIKVGSSNVVGAAAGVKQIDSGVDTRITGVAPSPVTPPAPAAKKTQPASKAGFGLLGLIPAAGLVWYGVHRRRRASA